MSLNCRSRNWASRRAARILFARILSFLLILVFFLSSLGESGVHVRAADALPETDLYEAVRQTAYSYYMRGGCIQYNSMKARKAFFSPEDATAQNMNYTVCSSFIQNVYYDLLGVAIPPYTSSLLNYAHKYVGNPEVVLYGETDRQENHMLVYDESRETAVNYTNMAISQLLPYLKPGDILVYTGHAMLVYDLIYAESGKVRDAWIMESGHGYNNYNITTKISEKTRIGKTIRFGNPNHLLYCTDQPNRSLAEGQAEGSLHMGTLKTSAVWENLSVSRKEQYAVLRFLRQEGGDILLTYHGTNWAENDYDSTVVALPDNTLDRLKYPNLYIEKTVDVFADSVVEAGDTLTYQITVVNESGADYTDDIWVTENVSEYAEYDSYVSSAKVISYSWDSAENTLRWNIGPIRRGEKVLIKYRVTAKETAAGKRIESTGMVGRIPSASIANPVQAKTPEGFSAAVAAGYEELKDSFSGLELIGRIYEQAAGTDLGLTELKISELVNNKRPTSITDRSISLSKKVPMYGAVLNNCWGALARRNFSYGDKTVYAYDLKYWGGIGDENRRVDTIYEENFRTGDVLIYSNSKDFEYLHTDGKNPAKRTYITRENGVYAYIFIEGRGFVGVNFGADGAAGTRDDRHEFSPAYYRDNGFSLYSNLYENDEDLLKFANYQTLFGKDCFVVLRPSLILFAPPEPEPQSEPDPSEEIAGDTESTEPVPGADAEEAAAARDPGVAAAAFVLLLGAAFCLCIYVLLKCREKDQDGR